MAALEALCHYFDSPMQDGSFLDALTARLGRKTITSVDLDAITEFFGELHFKEKPSECTKDDAVGSSPVISSCENPATCVGEEGLAEVKNMSSDSDSCRSATASRSTGVGPFPGNSKSLELCTEGLGSESCGDVEKPLQNLDYCREKGSRYAMMNDARTKPFEARFSNRRSKAQKFPPPISSIGQNGQPWVSFKSFKEDGRFVLREVRIPNREFLHVSREDGRLKLCFVQRNDEIETLQEEDEEDEREKEDGEGEVEAEDDSNDCNENGVRAMSDFLNISTL